MYHWMDGFVTITDKKVVKFVVNTGAGKFTRKEKMEKNQICGKISKMYRKCTVWHVNEMS